MIYSVLWALLDYDNLPIVLGLSGFGDGNIWHYVLVSMPVWYTPNSRERGSDARITGLVFLCFKTEMVEKQVSSRFGTDLSMFHRRYLTSPS